MACANTDCICAIAQLERGAKVFSARKKYFWNEFWEENQKIQSTWCLQLTVNHIPIRNIMLVEVLTAKKVIDHPSIRQRNAAYQHYYY